MRRQSEGWNEAEKKLKSRGMRLLGKWTKLAHAVDIGNEIKKYSRNKLSYYARGNTISLAKGRHPSVERVSHEQMVDIIENIINDTNVAYQLADENENFKK